VPFLEDQDRWLVALILILHWYGGHLMRNAATIIAAENVGNEVNAASDPDCAPVYQRGPPGMKVVAFGRIDGIMGNGEFKNTLRGARAARIEGRADTLRRKANAALKNPSNQLWLTLVPPAIALLRLVGHGVTYTQLRGKTAIETTLGMLRAAGEGDAAEAIAADWLVGVAPDAARLNSPGEPIAATK
jgi:hypothetical protein